MPMSDSPGPVLVAVDFFPAANEALLWAGRYVAVAGLELVVLHVVHDEAEHAGTYAPVEGHPELVDMEAVGSFKLDECIKQCMDQYPKLQEGQPWKNFVVSGLPDTRILEVIQKTKAQLLVIGCHSQAKFNPGLGSTASRLVKESPIPVTVVKHSQ